MIIFKDLSSLDYIIAKTNISEKGQTYLYNDNKMYLVRVADGKTKLVCNRVLQNDLTSNRLGKTYDCAILDKWGYK